MTRQQTQISHETKIGFRFDSLLPMAVAAGIFIALLAQPSNAKSSRVTYKSSNNAVSYRASDPKSFQKSLSYLLEKQSPDNPNVIEAQAALAELLFNSGNYRESAQIYLQLSETPNADTFKSASFQYRLAECYFHMGLYGESYDQFTKIRKSGHKALESEATLGMSMAALALGNRTSAQAHLDILLLENEFYKTYSRSLYPLGIMLYQNEQYKRAVEFFEKDLDSPTNLYFAGLSYRRLGELPKALTYFQRLTQKFPGTVWAQRGSFEVAESYYQQQDFQLAYQSFQNWLNEFPNGTLQIEAQYRLACCDIRRENYPQVVTRLEPLMKLDLRPALAERIRHLVVESWVHMGKIDELVNYVKKKGRSKDRTPDDNYQLMWALAALGQYNEALSLSETSLNANYDPELTPKILLVQGYSHDRSGRPAEALAAYQTVVDRFPDSAYAARALYLMAIAYVKAQRWQELVTHVYHHWAGLPEDIRRSNPEVEFWITEGQLSLGNYEIAQKRYQDFLSFAPDHALTPYAYLGMAVAQAQNGQLDLGFQTLQQFAAIARQKKRNDWLALATLQSGNIYYNQKKYEQAIGYYRSFRTDNSTDTRVPQVMFQEGTALSRLEYFTDAIDIWTKLAEKYPDNPLTEKARFQSARTLFDLGQTTAAVKAYQTFIVKHPDSPRIKEARLQLAYAYYNSGDYKDAIPKFQEFKALYPTAEEMPAVQEALQVCYVQVGKTDKELEDLTRGGLKSQVLADVYWEKGAKAFNAKDYPTSLGYFEKILIEFPASPTAAQASFYRAEALYLTEKYDESVAAYKNFLAQYPADSQAPTAMFHMGVALFNKNLFEEAALTFEGLVQKYPNDPLAQSAAENIPLAYAKLGRTNESESAFEKLIARESDPKKKSALLVQLGQIKENKGAAMDAIKYYEQVDPSADVYPEALYNTGAIYSRAGQTDKEIPVYEKLLKYSPKENEYRISAISRLAELYIAAAKPQQALSVYQDVAANSKDQQSIDNAKTRIDELQKVLQ